MENKKYTIDGSTVLSKKEAKQIVKNTDIAITKGDIKSFVSIKNINKIYPNGVQAVYDFNIDIDEHDFLVLVGPSGCGKSTTLRMVAGLEEITSGYLYINGVLSNFLESKERDISMVFQSYALYPNMTVFDNIAFPLKVRKYPRHLNTMDVSVEDPDGFIGDDILDIQTVDDMIAVISKPEELWSAYEECKEKNYSGASRKQYFATKFNINDKTAKLILRNKFTSLEDISVRGQEIIRALAAGKEKFIRGVEGQNIIITNDYKAIDYDGNEVVNPKISSLLEKLHEIEANANGNEEALAQANEIRYQIQKKNRFISENYEILDWKKEPINTKGKLTKKQIRDKVFSAAKILDLGPYLDRKPNELSGGQMQRVALGRAIVRDARLFLMDEPLSNLDAKLRVSMRSEIVRIHEQVGATTIYVTHDQTEAMTMATKIAVMSKGWVQQVGKPEEIYNNPSNIFVATFIGAPAMNIVDATYNNGTVTFNANGFKVDLGEEVAKKHDEFYKAKIADCERMLASDDFKKMHGIAVLEAINEAAAANNTETISAKLVELEEVAASIENLEERAQLLELTQQIKSVTQGELNIIAIRKYLLGIKSILLTIKHISSDDLSKLHNAQVFSAKGKAQEAKDEILVYRKAHKKKKNKKHKINFRVNDLTFSNNLYEVAAHLLESYKACLAGEHKINFGIRPEHIHLANEIQTEHKSDVLTLTSDVVELLGTELLIHSSLDYKDFIAKISTGTIVPPHSSVELAIDLDKVYLFDVESGDTIK